LRSHSVSARNAPPEVMSDSALRLVAVSIVIPYNEEPNSRALRGLIPVPTAGPALRIIFTIRSAIVRSPCCGATRRASRRHCSSDFNANTPAHGIMAASSARVARDRHARCRPAVIRRGIRSVERSTPANDYSAGSARRQDHLPDVSRIINCAGRTTNIR